MDKKIIVTMDMEQDISKYLKNSYKGMEEGVLHFLELVENHGIVVDFFITADVCERYPDVIKRIAQKGHKIGCHGYDHSIEYYCKLDYKGQYEDILKASKILEKSLGKKPTMFRAPNFSADGNTIKALEQLGFAIDSSVLPDRVVKKWKIFTIYNLQGAPRTPYYPSLKSISAKGESKVLEIPLTENPHLQGAPVGMGYLNYAGLNKTVAAIKGVKSNYVTFLVHPWELVDLNKYYPNLKSWVFNICSADLKPLDSLIDIIGDEFEFITLEKIKAVADFS